jgi:hypothetical protein
MSYVYNMLPKSLTAGKNRVKNARFVKFPDTINSNLSNPDLLTYDLLNNMNDLRESSSYWTNKYKNRRNTLHFYMPRECIMKESGHLPALFQKGRARLRVPVANGPAAFAKRKDVKKPLHFITAHISVLFSICYNLFTMKPE